MYPSRSSGSPGCGRTWSTPGTRSPADRPRRPLCQATGSGPRPGRRQRRPRRPPVSAIRTGGGAHAAGGVEGRDVHAAAARAPAPAQATGCPMSAMGPDSPRVTRPAPPCRAARSAWTFPAHMLQRARRLSDKEGISNVTCASSACSPPSGDAPAACCAAGRPSDNALATPGRALCRECLCRPSGGRDQGRAGETAVARHSAAMTNWPWSWSASAAQRPPPWRWLTRTVAGSAPGHAARDILTAGLHGPGDRLAKERSHASGP